MLSKATRRLFRSMARCSDKEALHAATAQEELVSFDDRL